MEILITCNIIIMLIIFIILYKNRNKIDTMKSAFDMLMDKFFENGTKFVKLEQKGIAAISSSCDKVTKLISSFQEMHKYLEFMKRNNMKFESTNNKLGDNLNIQNKVLKETISSLKSKNTELNKLITKLKQNPKGGKQ